MKCRLRIKKNTILTVMIIYQRTKINLTHGIIFNNSPKKGV